MMMMIANTLVRMRTERPPMEAPRMVLTMILFSKMNLVMVDDKDDEHHADDGHLGEDEDRKASHRGAQDGVHDGQCDNSAVSSS